MDEREVTVTPGEPAAPPLVVRRRRGAGLGGASVLLAIGMVVTTTVGSLLADASAASTPLAVIALAFSLSAIVTGILAVVRGGPARTAGVVGLLLGVLLNPVLLALVLPRSLP